MQHASNVTHLHNIAGRQQTVSGREAKPKLLDQLREALRSRHYSRRTDVSDYTTHNKIRNNIKKGIKILIERKRD
jgi:hypothetical protein